MLTGDETAWLDQLKQTADADNAREKAFQRWKKVKDLFGAKLRVARAAKDYTIRKVAELVGLSPQAISKYETGKMMPRPETLIRLSELYGVDVGWLLCDCPINLSCAETCSLSKRER